MNMLKRLRHTLDLRIGITLFLSLEFAFVTFFQNDLGPWVSPFVLLFSGLLSGMLFVRFAVSNDKALPVFEIQIARVSRIAPLALSFVLAVGVAMALKPLFAEFLFGDPHTARGSDIIPQIEILVRRWQSGVFPYQWIRAGEWSFVHDLYPTYLPLTWLPFTIAERIGVDYRWFAYSCLVLSLVFATSLFCGDSLKRNLIIASVPFVALFIWLNHDAYDFSLSIETLIVGYYVCFATSLLTRSVGFRGLSLILCLLSRYSIILWVPLFLLIILDKEGKRRFAWLVTILFLGILLLYYVPFLSYDLTIFRNGYEYHSNAAFAAWHPRDWQAVGDTPDNLLKGLGFGALFYEWTPGGIAEKVGAYRKAHFVLSLLSVLALALYYFRMRGHVNYKLFLLGSLKIYLVVFYNFIQIPFHYLYLVPVFIGLPMIGVLWPGSDATAAGILRADKGGRAAVP